MMKTLKTTLSILALICALFAHAQESPKAVLSNSDIDMMIKTMKPMMKDFEKLGTKYEGIEDPNALQAMAASEEVKAVFKKHGWGDDYLQKYMAITNGYAYLKMEEEYANMPEEQKVYMKQVIEQYKLGQKGLVNAQDLALIKSNFSKIDTFFTTFHD